MVISLERDADLHMAQLMPLQLTVSCFSKIQIGFTFLVPAYPGSPGKRAVKRVCVCVCVSWHVQTMYLIMELCCGGDLSSLLRSHGPFTEDETIAVLDQLARAISYLHRNGTFSLLLSYNLLCLYAITS